MTEHNSKDEQQRLEKSFSDALGVPEAELKGVFEEVKKEDEEHVRKEDFNERAFYDQEIWPRMKELAMLCKEKKLPFMFWVISSCTGNACGNGMIASTAHHICGRELGLLANIADGTVPVEAFAKAVMIGKLLEGGNNKKGV